jgi:hypothetical protein
MRNQLVPILRGACVVLAALALLQLAQIIRNKNPLSDLRIEPLALGKPAEKASVETNAPTAPARMAAKQPDLAPNIRASVDRVTQSEIFAAIVRPLPMALLGVAGQDAFIRTPTGQVGLMREGQELGGVKLLRIGTNRVLVEHEEQKKELMIFAGFGGETLISAGEKNPQ